MDPSGVFPTSYRSDRRLIRTRWQFLALVVFMALLLLAPYLVSSRIIAILNMMMISAVIAVGLQICTGYAGQINLGQAAFMGVGAYTASILASKTGLTFLLTIPLAGLSAALFGFLFGLTAARIKGFYLALTMIAAQFLFPLCRIEPAVNLAGWIERYHRAPGRAFRAAICQRIFAVLSEFRRDRDHGGGRVRDRSVTLRPCLRGGQG
jgi:branched-subunit amino acid ABC-type transport system permease component